jgi:hypothetical protein
MLRGGGVTPTLREKIQLWYDGGPTPVGVPPPLEQILQQKVQKVPKVLRRTHSGLDDHLRRSTCSELIPLCYGGGGHPWSEYSFYWYVRIGAVTPRNISLKARRRTYSTMDDSLRWTTLELLLRQKNHKFFKYFPLKIGRDLRVKVLLLH